MNNNNQRRGLIISVVWLALVPLYVYFWAEARGWNVACSTSIGQPFSLGLLLFLTTLVAFIAGLGNFKSGGTHLKTALIVLFFVNIVLLGYMYLAGPVYGCVVG